MHLLLEKYMPEQVPYQNMATCTVDCATTCMGMSVVRLRSIKSSLPSLYPLRHSWINYSRPSLTFSILQATESWVGPENEASYTPMKLLNSQMTVTQHIHSEQQGVGYKPVCQQSNTLGGNKSPIATVTPSRTFCT